MGHCHLLEDKYKSWPNWDVQICVRHLIHFDFGIQIHHVQRNICLGDLGKQSVTNKERG